MKIDNNIVVAYNVDRPYPAQIDHSGGITYLHMPIYDRTDVPYLCAVPLSPDFSGALLGRLGQTIDHFPLVVQDGKYTLRPKLASRWLSLEKELCEVAMSLLQLSAEPVVPLNYKFPPLPHTRGFMESYSSAHNARMAIQRSRDAFLPIIAHVAWAAMLYRAHKFWHTYSNTHADVRDCDLDVGWKTVLEKKLGKHAGWIQTLLQSDVCDFHIKRTGVVIRNPKGWPYMNKVIPLIFSNIPVWLIWGDNPPHKLPGTWSKEHALHFGPTPAEVLNARVWVIEEPTRTANEESVDSEIWNDEMRPIINLSHKPIHCIKDGQGNSDLLVVRPPDRPQQAHSPVPLDVHAWISMKKLKIEKAFQTADGTQRARWEQREKAALQHECPGPRGAMVFEWDKDDDGKVMRTRVTRANVYQAWSMFGRRQRWFNCVENEWELCLDLDPSDWVDDSDSEYAIGSDSYSIDGHEPLRGWMTQAQAMQQHEWSSETLNVFELEDMQDKFVSDMEDLSGDAFELVTTRFGFSYSPGITYESCSTPPIKLQKALRIFGDGFHNPVYSMRKGAEASFIQFVMHLDSVGHPDNDVTEIPIALCDTYADNPQFVGNRQSTVIVTHVSDMDSGLYVIRHRTSVVHDWVLAVKDQCTALQCIRSNPVSLEELVREFIHKRIAFFTFKSADITVNERTTGLRKRSKAYIANRTGLGPRPEGHVLDLTDYIAYEGIKQRLLQNGRIARAVVKRGGILARLASGLVDEYQVLDGPEFEQEGWYTRVTMTIDGHTREYFDDDLTEEEIASVVGLYSFQGLPLIY